MPPVPCSLARREQLETQITELAAHIRAATYRLLELIREFDDAHGWAGPGLNSVAHWLNWKCGINLGAAREKVRVVHAIKDLPKISDRFRRGEVSYSKVRAMTRVATEKNEDCLLQIACYGTAAHVERVVRLYRKVKRAEALTRDNERHAMRKLVWYFDDDGCFVLKGRFPGFSCSRFVDAHHIRHWADGGETRMDNLVLLCRRHHRMVHEEGFAIHTPTDGQIYFTDPQGKHLPDAAKTRFRGNVIAITTGNARSGLNIGPQNGACQWGGEHMDDDMAVLGMLQLE